MYGISKLPLKKLKTNNIYKASNVVFDADKIEAFSYDWWQFVTKVDDIIFFNEYKYSISTQGHQRKVLATLNHLGFGKAIHYVNTRDSLRGKTQLELLAVSSDKVKDIEVKKLARIRFDKDLARLLK